MDPAIAATLIGVLCAALLGVFAGAFHLLRSDIRRVETRFDRLEGKLDGLLLALARSGHLVEPGTLGPPTTPTEGDQSP